MSFSTISTFSSLKFPTTGISINYVFPNIDGSMSIYYTFNFSSSNTIPNYKSGTPVYDANIIGDGSIDNTIPNYIIGNGALKLTNTTNSLATQYVQNTTPIYTVNNNNNLSISVWFNPSSLSANNLYTLFDIIGNVGSNGIQIDLSGINSICYGYYDTITIPNLLFNIIDGSGTMSIYYPFNSAINKTVPNFAQSNIRYDGEITGSITNDTANFILGNGALQVVNSNNGTTATQYVRTNTAVTTDNITGITISIWFNPSTSLSANGFYTLFDIAGNAGNKGIQLDLSGTNMICSELFY